MRFNVHIQRSCSTFTYLFETLTLTWVCWRTGDTDQAAKSTTCTMAKEAVLVIADSESSFFAK